jgi:hypothetical protein
LLVIGLPYDGAVGCVYRESTGSEWGDPLLVIRFLGAVFMMLLVEYLSTASFPDTWKGDRFIRLLWGVFP